MIKKLSIIILVLTSFQYLMKAQEPSLDKILEKYFSINGFKKLQKVKSIVMSGTITRNDLMPIKITKMRPDKYRMDFELADLDAVQAYDGKIGWSTAPWTGTSEATLMKDDGLKEIKATADFDGLLYGWKEKGHAIELMGKEMLGTIEVYKIKLTRKDSATEFYLIGTKDFLLKKRMYTKNVRGQIAEMANIYSDYKLVEDIIFPFVNETLYEGQRYSLIEYEKIELNVPIDEKIFGLPQ
jgi:hypothetical protein